MNLFDLVVILATLFAMVGGWRLGLLARALSWIGLALGLLLAVRVLPDVIAALQGAQSVVRLLVAIGVLLGGALLGQALGLLVGSQFHRVLPFGPLRLLDRAFGAVAGLVGVLVALWILLPAMADVSGWPARAARNSLIAQTIDLLAPKPPDALQALRRVVGEDQFPQVFSRLRPSLGVGPAPQAKLSPAVQARVIASTVKVSGVACRRIQEGSGFVAQPDMIVTNAHVVAGERETEVLRPDGRRLRAVVTAFDPDRDLALLRVTGLDRPPLPLDEGSVGDVGAVVGHPGGQDKPRATPAAIRQEVTAAGRDLYDEQVTRRRVFVLASDLHPGDSGGPLVDQAGSVLGVAFAIAPDQPGTAYALTTDELRPVLRQAELTPVNTGPCLTGT